MAFDYTTLFANGEAGGAWFADEAHFQDDARTVAAGDGDPVGSFTDISGNGLHASQATAGDKPTLRQDAGGKWYLEFNEDFLTAGVAADWGFMHYSASSARAFSAVAFRPALTADPAEDYALINTYEGAPGFVYEWLDSGIQSESDTIRWPNIFLNAAPAQNDILLDTYRYGATIYTSKNGKLLGSGTGQHDSNTGNDPTATLHIGAEKSGASYGDKLKGYIYGIVLRDKVPTDAELEAIRTDMLSRMLEPPTFSFGNNASLANTDPVQPVEYVMIFKVQPDNSWALAYQVQPDAVGDWSVDVSAGTYYLAYITSGYQPLIRGPYTK